MVTIPDVYKDCGKFSAKLLWLGKIVQKQPDIKTPKITITFWAKVGNFP